MPKLKPDNKKVSPTSSRLAQIVRIRWKAWSVSSEEIRDMAKELLAWRCGEKNL